MSAGAAAAAGAGGGPGAGRDMAAAGPGAASPALLARLLPPAGAWAEAVGS